MKEESRLDLKAGFKRKYHSKSRKGCSTCKKRRVKCDELKPSCGNCARMKLTCGYLQDESPEEPAPKRVKEEHTDAMEEFTPGTQQATPAKSPSPLPRKLETTMKMAASALGSGLLSAGNLNNINISQLVNNLSSMGDLSSLGGFANLSNLAALAQLPSDMGSITSHLSSLGVDLSSFNLGALADLPQVPEDISRLTIHGNEIPLPSVACADQSEAIDLMMGVNSLPGKMHQKAHPNQNDLPRSDLENPTVPPTGYAGPESASQADESSLNMLDLRLMYHYTTHVSSTITGAGISDTDIWNNDIPTLAFEYPFLMHALLAFSATHLSRTEKGLDQCVTRHRGDALRLLREAILDIRADNTDALVASALILIMDSLANASVPSLTSPMSLPASAWIFHVKGAATILTAVWPLTETSRFYKFIGVDLGDLGDIINQKSQLTDAGLLSFANLDCHDSSIADLYPVPINSPYLITLAYLSKLHKERYKADFILRIFAFPALLEKEFLGMLMSGDIKAMRIMRSYYKLLRSFTLEMKDKVWFLEGVSSVLPVDVEEYAGGAGGMHMMLDFLGGGPAIVEDHEVDKDLSMIDPGGKIADKLIDTNNLPSEITSNLDIMQGDNGIMEMKLD